MEILKSNLLGPLCIHDANSTAFNSIEDLKMITKKIENMNLAIYTAASIGCNTIKIDISQIILKHNPAQILNLLWEIIRTHLFLKIDLEKTKSIYDRLDVLVPDCNHQDLLYSLGPEDIILRWLNYHLQKNPKCPTYETYETVKEKGKEVEITHVHKVEMTNFEDDLMDCVAIQCLLEQLQNLEAEHNDNFDKKKILLPNFETNVNPSSRALHTLKMADVIGGKLFLTYKDILNGSKKLMLAFLTNLFNTKMHIHKPGMVMYGDDGEELIETKEETKMKNWINSLNLRSTCNYLFTDLRDGIILLKLVDRIVPDTVKWKKVNFPPFEKEMKKEENCDYAIKLIINSKMKVKLGSIRGHNIYTADPKNVTLGLLKQLMRAYSFSMLLKMKEGDWRVFQNYFVIVSYLSKLTCLFFHTSVP